MMKSDDGNDPFEELMDRLRRGDDSAETAVFRRYVDRLIALAARQFDEWMRDRADAEGVVLSAYRSFFRRNARGEYDFAGWDDLWLLLAVITRHKCTKRRKHLFAARRDARRDVAFRDATDQARFSDSAPAPVEAAILRETVEMLFQAMTPGDRPVLELILMGNSTEEVAIQTDRSTRTVKRVRKRVRQRLERLLEVPEPGPRPARR